MFRMCRVAVGVIVASAALGCAPEEKVVIPEDPAPPPTTAPRPLVQSREAAGPSARPERPQENPRPE